ncbi:MAG: ThuA domain-containing protein [Defluviitaleaceae bacterium]|nr:ThuA domain-containing protein [Defluviitaleaceae bacterium]MCL2261877.1 ThuA domain-containing protein [Defluviitaleaceae bacterium]
MKILLFCDDHYHPGQIPADGTKSLAKKGHAIDIITDATEFKPSMLAGYDVVIMSKCDHISQANNAPWKTAEIQTEFVKYVENGGGLLVTHSGTVAGDNNATDILDRLIGCRFATHPNNCPVTVGAVRPHPVTDGVEIFTETDEHYHLEILAQDIEIIAASYSLAQGDPAKYQSEPYFNAPAHIAPAAYTRTQGKGKICVLTPGHALEVWLNPNFAKMLENAVRWCAGL